MMDLIYSARFGGKSTTFAPQASRAAPSAAFADLMVEETQTTGSEPEPRELTTISWSEALAGKQGDIIIAKDAEDRALRDAWFADYMERHPAPSLEDYEPLPNLSDVLTDDDWKELASKYDPSCMTQQEYDCFLDDLVEMGALHTSDLADLGHSEYAPKWVLITAATLRPQMANESELPPGGSVPTFVDGRKYVNILYWAQEEKSWQYYDEDQNGWARDHKALAFGQIYQVLRQMQLFR